MTTILHKLLERENINTEYLEILLKNGSDVNSQDKNGLSLLHVAVKKNKIDIVSLLLNNNSNPNLQDKDGQTPLHKCFNDNGKQINNAIVKLLLEKNADPNITDKKDRTCLYYAFINSAEKCNLETIKLLIDKNVDIYNGLNSNYSPLWEFFASSNNQFNDAKMEIFSYLCNKNKNFDVKFYAQNYLLVLGWNYRGEPLTKEVNFETTPLLWALEHKHFELAKKIIGLNVDLKFRGGIENATALELACYMDCPEIVNLILPKLNDKNTMVVKIEEDKKDKDFDIMQ